MPPLQPIYSEWTEIEPDHLHSKHTVYVCDCCQIVSTAELGPVIFRFKKSNFPFQKKWNSVSIPFLFRFIIGNVEFDEITIYRKKVRWTDRQNGTISAVNWIKRAQLARWTEEKVTINTWMDNKRGTAQSTLCVDDKKDKTAKSHVWLTFREFLFCFEFHGFRFKFKWAIPRLFRDRGKSLALQS